MKSLMDYMNESLVAEASNNTNLYHLGFTGGDGTPRGQVALVMRNSSGDLIEFSGTVLKNMTRKSGFNGYEVAKYVESDSFISDVFKKFKEADTLEIMAGPSGLYDTDWPNRSHAIKRATRNNMNAGWQDC